MDPFIYNTLQIDQYSQIAIPLNKIRYYSKTNSKFEESFRELCSSGICGYFDK